MAGGYLAISNGHVNVDIIHSKFPVRVRALVDVLTSAMFFIFMGALLYFGVSIALDSMETWAHAQPVWNPPICQAMLVIPVATALLLLQGIVKFLKDILTVAGVTLPADLAADSSAPEEHA